MMVLSPRSLLHKSDIMGLFFLDIKHGLWWSLAAEGIMLLEIVFP